MERTQGGTEDSCTKEMMDAERESAKRKPACVSRRASLRRSNDDLGGLAHMLHDHVAHLLGIQFLDVDLDVLELDVLARPAVEQQDQMHAELRLDDVAHLEGLQ